MKQSLLTDHAAATWSWILSGREKRELIASNFLLSTLLHRLLVQLLSWCMKWDCPFLNYEKAHILLSSCLILWPKKSYCFQGSVLSIQGWQRPNSQKRREFYLFFWHGTDTWVMPSRYLACTSVCEHSHFPLWRLQVFLCLNSELYSRRQNIYQKIFISFVKKSCLHRLHQRLWGCIETYLCRQNLDFVCFVEGQRVKGKWTSVEKKKPAQKSTFQLRGTPEKVGYRNEPLPVFYSCFRDAASGKEAKSTCLLFRTSQFPSLFSHTLLHIFSLCLEN